MVLLLFLFREASRATQTTDRNWAETTVLASTAEVEGVEGEGKTMVTTRPGTFIFFCGASEIRHIYNDHDHLEI